MTQANMKSLISTVLGHLDHSTDIHTILNVYIAIIKDVAGTIELKTPKPKPRPP